MLRPVLRGLTLRHPWWPACVLALTALQAAAQAPAPGPAPATTPAPAPSPAPVPSPVPPPPATLPAPARDATVPAPAEPPADAPQRIEITADTQSDTEQRRRDPVARTIVGRDELDRFNDPSVLDVLKRQPGVNLSGGNPRLRGLGAGYTLILVNGERAPPGFSLENLPPSQVERIEITKGPTAEHSAQAVAGTINIILRSAPRQRQRELAFRAGYTRGKPVFGANATWADRVGPFTVSVPVSGYTWSSGQTVRGERLSRDTALLLQRVAYEGDERWWGGGATVGPRVNWRVSDATTLEWSAFLQRNEFRNANDFVNRVVAGSTPRSLLDTSVSGGFWKTARTGLSLQQRWPGGARLEARAGLQATRNAWSGHFEGRDTAGQLAVVRDNTGRNDEDSGSTSGKFTWPWGEAHTLAAGWDIDRRDRTEVRSVVENGVSQLIGFDARPFEAQIDRSAVYVQDEWQLSPRWGAYLGLRAERIVTTSRDDGDVRRSASQVVTPILHLQHRFDAKGRDLLRIGLTRSYRAPDIGALMARPSINSNFPASGPNNEQYPDRNGNPQLKPELSWGLDIALEQYLPRGGVISAGLFHRRVQGLIRNVVSEQAVSWSPVPRWVSVPVNLPGARSTGLELEVKGRADDLLPALPLPGAMNLRASLSVYRSQVDDIPGPDNRLEAQQPWQLGLGLDHRVAGTPLGFGVGFQFTPGYRTQLNTQQSRQVNRVRNLDGYLSWQFSPAVTVRLSGNNLPHVQNGARHETVETAGTTLFDDARRRQRHTVFLGVSARL